MKNLKNLGAVLSKTEQKLINGGFGPFIGSGCFSPSSRCPETWGINNTPCDGMTPDPDNGFIGTCFICPGGGQECRVS